MLEDLKVGTTPRRRMPYIASLLTHAFVLAWMIWGQRPIFVAPASALAGNHGLSSTRLYWPTDRSSDAGMATPKASRNRQQQKATSEKLTYKPTPAAHMDAREQLQAKGDAPSLTRQTSADAAAGNPYGSAGVGSPFDHEIRPALPISALDPVVAFDELQGSEGDVVVEITIDEAGNIVGKTVLNSMGPLVDGRVLAALEGWHFRPAMRDGMAIASKQDVHYHFKPY